MSQQHPALVSKPALLVGQPQESSDQKTQPAVSWHIAQHAVAPPLVRFGIGLWFVSLKR
jgi:hypothetical protein